MIALIFIVPIFALCVAVAFLTRMVVEGQAQVETIAKELTLVRAELEQKANYNQVRVLVAPTPYLYAPPVKDQSKMN